MSTRAPTFTDAKHKKLAVYFLKVMEAVRDGALAPDDAREEVMQCIAVPMIGGMVSSTILTLVVIPAIYALVKGFGITSGAASLSSSAFARVG